MMWFWVTIASYFLNSLSLLINKFLLQEKIKNPAVYTVFTCFLMLLSFIFLPFDWRQPSFYEFIIELLAGFLFGLGVLFMFIALKQGETSRVIPIIGGLQPLVVLPLAWYWLGETINSSFFIALLLIIGGTFLINYEAGKLSKKNYLFSFLSAVFFAISVVATKAAFNSQESFITPFVISRLGAVFLGILLLLYPRNLYDLIEELSRPKKQTGLLFFLSQGAGALASVLLNFAFAISSGVTTIINALQGIQYVFLLLGVIILSNFFPKVLKENLEKKILIQKIIATTLIIIGIVIISF